MTDTRNILLIGRTGGGKSTIANVLLNKNEQFEEVFRESSESVSETRDLQIELLEIKLDEEGKEKVNYRVVDTVGVGDTKIDPQGVL
jgi:septin family protein